MNSREIVSLSSVEKVYPPSQMALTEVSLKLNAGEFVFVAGASGAGKSTLLKLIFAQETASSGKVIVLGRNLASVDPVKRAELRREIGVIFQDYKLLETRNVIDNVAYTLEVSGVSRSERHRVAYQILEAVGLKEKINSYPRMLSGGEQQRVAIARALVNRPSLILADEPTGNLDPDMTLAVFKLLLEACSCGATVLVASHNLALIESLNKRTLVLDRGRLIGDFQAPGG